MKSFDEVTKALSICGRHLDCRGCPYENISYPTEIGNTCKDIMHYDALYYMQDRIDECQEANPPLTWDELREMVGKPVWVEALLYKQWAVIAYVGSDYIRFEGANLYAPESRTYMGADNGWQAFRKERK